jgi:hypothetical protein
MRFFYGENMFKVGDKVRVIKHCPEYWKGFWVYQMEKYVGNGVAYLVTKVDADGDIKLDLGVESWIFPPDSLELVKEDIEQSGLLAEIHISGYRWNDCLYTNKIALLRGIVKQRYLDFIATDCDVGSLDQFIEQLNEVKEVCQKLK